MHEQLENDSLNPKAAVRRAEAIIRLYRCRNHYLATTTNPGVLERLEDASARARDELIFLKGKEASYFQIISKLTSTPLPINHWLARLVEVCNSANTNKGRDVVGFLIDCLFPEDMVVCEFLENVERLNYHQRIGLKRFEKKSA